MKAMKYIRKMKKIYKIKSKCTIYHEKWMCCKHCGWWSGRLNKLEKRGVIKWAGIRKCVQCGDQPYRAYRHPGKVGVLKIGDSGGFTEDDFKEARLLRDAQLI
jgi:hypothetical protein